MAETEELKQMVLNFRRADLIELLGFVGHNKAGTKATLQQRALALVQSQRGFSLPVQIKIRDIYRNIHNPFADDGRTRSRTTAAADARRVGLQKIPQAHGLSGGLSQQSSTGAIDYRKQVAGADGLSPSGSAIPVHPDVTFKRLPFYDIMGELLKPTSLVPRGQSRYQETYFVFHLTPQQAQDVAMSRDFRPAAKFEYTVQIQLRFCFLETSCEQDDNFPPSICVRINGKMAQLPNPIPTTKPGVEPKRPGRPVDITSLCRISPTMPNHIEISWGSEFGRGYCVSVNLVKRLTSDILLSRLKQFGNRHADHTRALIKEKLHHDPDSEIATTSLRVSLMCPLGKMRMQLPCRAGSCSHLQCFDAITFLMMNEKKPTWNCPVCDKPTPFHKLIIDGLFVEILKKLADVNEIQFLEDGSWSPIRANRECHVISSPAPARSSSRVEAHVNLCEDSPTDSVTSSPSKRPKMDDVIDLTETDSEAEDDDDETPAESSHNISSGSNTPSPALFNGSTTTSEAVSPVPQDTKEPLVALSRSPAIPSPVSRSPLVPSPVSRSPLVPSPVSRSPLISSPVPSSPHKTSSSLPPMPPLMNYQGGVSPSSNGISKSPSKHSSPLKQRLESHSASYSVTNSDIFSSSNVVPSTTSWLTALSGISQGQKRPPPAHTGSMQPPPKRPYLENLDKSATPSPNSNMSPLVDLDQLCNLLDNDRSSSSEELSNLRFPADFNMPTTIAQARSVFNVSPSDIIDLD